MCLCIADQSGVRLLPQGERRGRHACTDTRAQLSKRLVQSPSSVITMARARVIDPCPGSRTGSGAMRQKTEGTSRAKRGRVDVQASARKRARARGPAHVRGSVRSPRCVGRDGRRETGLCLSFCSRYARSAPSARRQRLRVDLLAARPLARG